MVTNVAKTRYDQSNNMYSTLLNVKDQEFLFKNSDVYYDDNIIKGMLECIDCSKIACDRSLYLEESMKITLDGEKINHISKTIAEKEH